MVQIKVKGFVSNIYAFLNLFTTGVWGIFVIFITLPTNEDVSCVPMIFVLCVGITVYFFSNYLCAPIAYARFFMNSSGIGCGKEFVRYENIERIVICRGYVEKGFGFRFLENVLGIQQHTEIYVEDMICINCDSVNFRMRLAKGRMYIPINKKTDSIMRMYCKDYTSIIDAKNRDCSYAFEWRRRNIGFYIITTALLFLVLLGIALIAIVNGAISIYRGVAIVMTGFAWIVLASFENEIACLLKKILAI